MKTSKRIAVNVAALLTLVSLSGCFGGGMSVKEFQNKPPAEQERLIAQKEAQIPRTERFLQAKIKNFETVETGSGTARMKVVRSPAGNMAASVVEHHSGIPGLGMESVSIAQVPMTPDGRVVPKALTHTGGHQEDVIRWGVGKAANYFGLRDQGLSAAKEVTDRCKDGLCGGSGPVVKNFVSSTAASLATSEQEAGVNVAPF